MLENSKATINLELITADSELIGAMHAVEYKDGCENVTSDYLSQLKLELFMTLCFPTLVSSISGLTEQ